MNRRIEQLILAALVVVVGTLNAAAQAASNDFTLLADHIVHYSGVVTDPAGKPVPGAVVTAYPGQPSNAVVTTDREGRYQLEFKRAMMWNGSVEPYQYFIVQETNRNLSSIRGNGWQGSNADVQLQPGVTIAIIVKDSSGRPIPGAVGELSPMVKHMDGGASGTPLRPDMVADTDGRMEMKALPRGHAISLAIKAEGHGIKFVHASETDTDVENYRFPDVTLSGD